MDALEQLVANQSKIPFTHIRRPTNPLIAEIMIFLHEIVECLGVFGMLSNIDDTDRGNIR